MKGVVHVGAHHGEEVPDYFAAGRNPIHLFEPQFLQSIEYSGVFYHRFALGDFSGEFDLNIPYHLQASEGMDTQSASLLDVIPERAREIGWTPKPSKVIRVPVTRFDEWALPYRYERGSCDFLRIDVQGFELQVLWGFGEYLSDFDDIVVECSSPPIYRGGYSAEAVESFLTERGFTRLSPIKAHGDVSYTRIK